MPNFRMMNQNDCSNDEFSHLVIMIPQRITKKHVPKGEARSEQQKNRSQKSRNQYMYQLCTRYHIDYSIFVQLFLRLLFSIYIFGIEIRWWNEWKSLRCCNRPQSYGWKKKNMKAATTRNGSQKRQSEEEMVNVMTKLLHNKCYAHYFTNGLNYTFISNHRLAFRSLGCFAFSASIRWVSSGRVRNLNLKLWSIKLFLKSELMRIALRVHSMATQTHLIRHIFQILSSFGQLRSVFSCVVCVWRKPEWSWRSYETTRLCFIALNGQIANRYINAIEECILKTIEQTLEKLIKRMMWSHHCEYASRRSMHQLFSRLSFHCCILFLNTNIELFKGDRITTTNVDDISCMK